MNIKINIHSAFFHILSVIFIHQLFFFSTHAEYGIQVSSCEVEMIKAFDIVREDLYKSYSQYLELPAVTAVAKSRPENLNFYQTRYTCQLDAICEAIRNPNPKYILSSEEKIYNCLGEQTSVEQYGETLGVDFSECRTPTNHDQNMNILQTYWSRCEDFASLQKQQFKQNLSVDFIRRAQKENQGVLAQKILDIRKRMDILIDKTRLFSIAFLKTNDDLHCTLPYASKK